MIEKQPKKKKRGKKILGLIVLMLAVCIGVGLLKGYRSAAKPNYVPYTAEVGTISNALSFPGTMALVDSRTYTASGDATVRALYVQVGERVKKDQRLLRLSDGTISADLEGTVNVLELKKDDAVTAGQTLLQIADLQHMKVQMRIDEYDIANVEVGQDCEITITATGEKLHASIDTINYVSTASYNVAYFTATAYVDIPEGMKVFPGMQASVSIPREEARDVVVLRADALSFDERNLPYVLRLLPDGSYERVNVEAGVSNGALVEIRNGLSQGDVVYAEDKGRMMPQAEFFVDAPNQGDSGRDRPNRGRPSGHPDGGW